MRMNYCIECGTELITKYLAGEGDIPFCTNCNEFRFPMFSTAVSMIVTNKNQDKILLIQQNKSNDFMLVAGYVDKGENAEQTVKREVLEELGIEVSDLQYNKSQYFEKSNTLMLNFTCVVATENLGDISEEVDYTEWFSIDEAREKIQEGSVAQFFLENYISELQY